MTVSNRPTMTPEAQETRRTVIPTPRTDALFPGWGIRF